MTGRFFRGEAELCGRASMVVLMLAVLPSAATGAEHTVEVRLVSHDDESLILSLDSTVEPAYVERLSGLSIRFCWSPASDGPPVSSDVLSSDAHGTHEWQGGPASMQRCQRVPDSAGVPMTWLDEAMTWPPSAQEQLARVQFERDRNHRKPLHVWVEGIGMAAGQTLVNPVLTVAGTEVFRNGFGH